jgi:hypothetical protein
MTFKYDIREQGPKNWADVSLLDSDYRDAAIFETSTRKFENVA